MPIAYESPEEPMSDCNLYIYLGRDIHFYTNAIDRREQRSFTSAITTVPGLVDSLMIKHLLKAIDAPCIGNKR